MGRPACWLIVLMCIAGHTCSKTGGLQVEVTTRDEEAGSLIPRPHPQLFNVAHRKARGPGACHHARVVDKGRRVLKYSTAVCIDLAKDCESSADKCNLWY